MTHNERCHRSVWHWGASIGPEQVGETWQKWHLVWTLKDEEEFIRWRRREGYSRRKSDTKIKRSGSPLRDKILASDNVNVKDWYSNVSVREHWLQAFKIHFKKLNFKVSCNYCLALLATIALHCVTCFKYLIVTTILWCSYWGGNWASGSLNALPKSLSWKEAQQDFYSSNILYSLKFLFLTK